MNDNHALDTLKQMVLDGSLFDKKSDVVELAKQNGFVVYNARMDEDYDGFIAINENKEFRKYGSTKVIGVNVSNELKDKKALIAQELFWYYAQKLDKTGTKLNFIRMDTLDPDKVEPARNVILALENAKLTAAEKVWERKRDTSNAIPREVLDPFILTANLSSLIRAQEKGPQKTQSALFKKVNSFDAEEAECSEDLDKNWITSKSQRQRDEHVEDLLGDYVSINKDRERQRMQDRKTLFVFCLTAASVIIVVSLAILGYWVSVVARQYLPRSTVMQTSTPAPAETTNTATPAPNGTQDGGTSANNDSGVFSLEGLFIGVALADDNAETGTDNAEGTPTPEPTATSDIIKDIENYMDSALASNASTAAKDIVAMISICITILGSIFGILRMIAKYVLPEKEEETMHAFVKSVQENDFKDKIVHRLYEVKEYDKIIEFLSLPNKPVKQESHQQPKKPGEEALEKIQKTLDELKELVKK